MGLANQLLAVADGPASICDLLLERAETTKTCPVPAMRGQTSYAVSLEQSRNGGVQKAVAVATYHRDPEVLVALVAKDRRVTVRRAALMNPATPMPTKATILRDALVVKTDGYDNDTVALAARNLPVRVVFDAILKARPEGAGRLPDGCDSLLPETEADAKAFLAGPFSTLRRNAVLVIARGAFENINLEAAIIASELKSEDILPALWNDYKTTITPEVSYRFLAAAGTWALRSDGMANVDPTCRPEFVRTGDPKLQVRALSAELTDELIELLAGHPTRDGIAAACEVVTTTEHATMLLELVIAHRVQTRLDRSADDQRAPRRYSGILIPESSSLTKGGLLDKEQLLALLRSGWDEQTYEWLQGLWSGCFPTAETISALLTDPGFAFETMFSVQTGPINETHRTRILSYGAGKTWLPAAIEATVGIGSMLEQSHRLSTEVTEYVYQRLLACFGENRQLWNMFLHLAPEIPATLAATIAVTAVSCGEELAAGPGATAPTELDAAALAAGQLF